MGVKAEGKVVSASFLNVERRRTLVGVKDQREGEIKELASNRNPAPKAPPMSKKGREGREQRKCQRRSNCQRSNRRRVVMSGSLRARRLEEMNQSNTFSPRGSKVTFESQRE